MTGATNPSQKQPGASTPAEKKDSGVFTLFCLTCVPRESVLLTNGGYSAHVLVNDGPKRVAFKVKCTANEVYRLRPVHGFVPAHGCTPLDIIRLPAINKMSWLVIQYCEADDSAINSQEVIRDCTPKPPGQLIVELIPRDSLTKDTTKTRTKD